MFEENNNINELDLMVKSILDEGQEEVPAGVWEAVSDGLDKAASRKAVVIWFRRAAVSVAAAAAGCAVGITANYYLDKVRADLSRLENDLEAKKAMNSKLSEKLEAAKSATDEAYKLPDDSSSLEKKEKLKNVQDNMNELLDAMAESF